MSKPTEIELHAGHAKKVSGAVGHINEFAENCRVVKRVYEILVASKVPATYYIDEVSSTQSQNINNLVAHHNKDRDGLIVSIHFNAGGDGSKAKGTECIYKTQKSLAEKVAKAISAASGNGLINRGAKYRNDLGVLNGTFEPAILIEVCFVNSVIDTALYKKHFEAICQAIAKELAAYLGKTIVQKPTNNKAAFLSEIATAVSDCWTKHQIMPSVVIAQAILESGWGTSDKALKANNLFGVKATSDWQGATVTLSTQEYVNNKWITVDAKWRKYDSWGASIVDHALFLKGRAHYKSIIGNGNYKSVCTELQKAGYATDPSYASKLISVIESNNLTQFDQEAEALVFSSAALEQKVNALLNDKNAQKEMIEKGITSKAFNESWRDKFNEDELAKHDILGLYALYAAVK